MPTHRATASTLVEELAGPVSTPSHDIDVVVTENGVADLRGLSRAERRGAICGLWAV
jgi:acyl-CoA hydrolase